VLLGEEQHPSLGRKCSRASNDAVEFRGGTRAPADEELVEIVHDRDDVGGAAPSREMERRRCSVLPRGPGRLIPDR
jgi:hypothetical protein